MKHVNFVEVRALAHNILKDDRRMLELTGELDAELKKLQATFVDDGIQDVNAYVKSLLTRLANAQSSFTEIATDLAEYANILESGLK